MESPVRVACVSFLNTSPLVEGLGVCADLSLSFSPPASIIDGLTGPEPSADIGLLSVIDAARSPEPLTALPAGMIGCDGPTLTVALFSRVEPGRITRLHADVDSHTSVTLARILLRDSFGVDPEIVPFDARDHQTPAGGSDEGWPESVVLIGDKVVSDSTPAGSYPHRLDLGQAWHERVGLPFVYALWMCRAADRDQPEIHAAAALLDRQRRRNMARLDQVVSAHAGPKGWPEELARAYVGGLLRYEVDARAREAAQTFLDMAARHGLAPETTLDWADAFRA